MSTCCDDPKNARTYKASEAPPIYGTHWPTPPLPFARYCVKCGKTHRITADQNTKILSANAERAG